MALLYRPTCAMVSVSPRPLSPAKISNCTALILRTPLLILHPPPLSSAKPISRATNTPQKYVYPDPIPEFAKFETQRFKVDVMKKLSKDKETFGRDLDKVVDVCAEIFSNFLHKEYGGPGTLLVEPFTDTFVALKEKKLPGAPLAARECLLWAQNYVDHDWEVWNSKPPN